MIGNLLSNVMIKELVQQKILIIDPFDDKLLQLSQYPLSPGKILAWKDKSEETVTFDLIENSGDYIFEPREYAMVTAFERIVLPDGIVGRFIPMSGLIEKGFGLTAGKLDPQYGNLGEEIRFGLCNLKNHPNTYDRRSPLAYVEFFDLRGLNSTTVRMTGYDELIRYMRRTEPASGS